MTYILYPGNPPDISKIPKQKAKYNLKVPLQTTKKTPTSLDVITTKKLRTYISIDKEISHKKALILVAMKIL